MRRFVIFLQWASAKCASIRPNTALAFGLLLLAGCATFNQPANRAVEIGSQPIAQFAPPDVGGDTAIALAFSGGGTRAAAFAFGVLRGLDHLPTKGGKSYLDRVIFVSEVSGGSITAAYFGLKGSACGEHRSFPISLICRGGVRPLAERSLEVVSNSTAGVRRACEPRARRCGSERRPAKLADRRRSFLP